MLRSSRCKSPLGESSQATREERFLGKTLLVDLDRDESHRAGRAKLNEPHQGMLLTLNMAISIGILTAQPRFLFLLVKEILDYCSFLTSGCPSIAQIQPSSGD